MQNTLELAKNAPMFCYQCEQTAHNRGCDILGICGKSPETAALQDVIVHLVKGLSQAAFRLEKLGVTCSVVNRKVLEALFMTLTNVNFDAQEHGHYIQGLVELLNEARAHYAEVAQEKGQAVEELSIASSWNTPCTQADLLAFARSVSIVGRGLGQEPDIISLQEMLTYGIKGMAAYAHHAVMLGYELDAVYASIHEALNYMTAPNQTLEQLLHYNLKCGETNFLVMELLDKAHTESFGHPVPTPVITTPVAGKAILVSGHDMKSLIELLKQTEGTGINIYTHGEMLPAHGYPGLKKYSHLAGHFGGAWQLQQTEFAQFPGAILMTTNCLKPPVEAYKNRLFTMDVVGWQGIPKVENYDYSALIQAAQQAQGYLSTPAEETILVGFGHNAVLGVADKVIDAVKAGQIKHFFLVGGCDGAEFARNYFTEFTEKAPSDTMVLTLGCGKFRFNRHDFGTVAGLPRLLDLGQCNDAYSAVKIASALAAAFECGINDLPLSLIISWFEQKAVAVLLTLLALGVKNIRLGPQLPAFITPNVLKLLIKNYNIQPIKTAQGDLDAILNPLAA